MYIYTQEHKCQPRLEASDPLGAGGSEPSDVDAGNRTWGPLQEHQVLLTAKPASQPPSPCFLLRNLSVMASHHCQLD